MPVSVADGLQSKEDSVRSEAVDVWTHSSLLFWKGVFGAKIDEEFMSGWCIYDGIYNCSLLWCCSAVRMYGMWKAVSLELFWSNILLCATPSRHACFRIILRISTLLKSFCRVLKKSNRPQHVFKRVSGSPCWNHVVFVWFWALGMALPKTHIFWR